MTDIRISDITRLANEAAAGRLEELVCPSCGYAAVSVWFTNPAPDVYRTWFICTNCEFHTRAQLKERPTHFSESRVDTELEESDLMVLKRSKFKRPPQQLM